MPRTWLIWPLLLLVLGLPVIAAATSPLLAWRDPVYILAGLAGVVGLCLMLLQPLLAAGYLPGLPPERARRLHLWSGTALVTAVLVHVAGLWITSPPDVVDALLFVSPTPFSAWGVVAMWALLAAAALAALRRRFRLRWRTWRAGHAGLAAIAVGGTAVHAILIQGTMEPVTKAILCAAAILATLVALVDLRVWGKRRLPRAPR